MCGLEMATELEMLRFSLGVTRKDKNSNVDFGGTAKDV